jgi:hypothetical protein
MTSSVRFLTRRPASSALLVFTLTAFWGCAGEGATASNDAQGGTAGSSSGASGSGNDGSGATSSDGGASGGEPSRGGEAGEPSAGTSAGSNEGGSGAGVGGADGGANDGGSTNVAGSGGEGGSIPSCVDVDGDGYGEGDGCLGADCDDDSPLVSPAMVELADDGADNDCADGDLLASAGVGYYVDEADPSCSDSAFGHGTQEIPYCTLIAAVVEAYNNTVSGEAVGRSIFVAQGTYGVSIGFPKSMRLYGGYDSSDWSYDPAAHETVIGGQDDMSIYSSWLTPTVDCNAVVQGFSIKGGKRPGEPIFGVEIYSTGRVVLAYNTIVAGTGYQTLGVNIRPEADDVLLIGNRISAGVAQTSSNYGLNNLGTATLWGNVIDAGQGKAGSWAAAVQNYGTMYLAANVLNGGDYGGGADDSYGFINLQTGDPPSAGTAYAVGNVIYGGRGSDNSIGVLSNSPLTLVDNVIGDRIPGALTWADRPNEIAEVLNLGFASSTVLENNALLQLIYSDEVSPPNVDAHRHLLTHSDVSTEHIEDIALVNVCDWTGCQSTSNNISGEPGFVGAPDFHLAGGSALLGAGQDPGSVIPGGLARLDPDGDLRPLGSAWEIGVDEQAE